MLSAPNTFFFILSFVFIPSCFPISTETRTSATCLTLTKFSAFLTTVVESLSLMIFSGSTSDGHPSNLITLACPTSSCSESQSRLFPNFVHSFSVPSNARITLKIKIHENLTHLLCLIYPQVFTRMLLNGDLRNITTFPVG